MKILNLFRSAPSDLVKLLTAGMSSGDQLTEVPLYKGNVDYAKLVKQIFESDRVICWW
jgi:hypothetical protein